MKDKRAAVALIVGVMVLTFAGWYLFSGSPNNADNPNGTSWLCQNNVCKNEFILTVKQLSDHHKAHYGQPPACPKCGKEASRASRCANCGKTSPLRLNTNLCPHCKKPMAAAAPT